MSTFLELCVKLRQEAGLPGSGPTSTVSQSGQSKKIVDWVNRAWMDIQQLYDDWLWMVGTFGSGSSVTVADDGTYTASDWGITDLRAWDVDKFSIYLQSAGVGNEQELVYLPYDDWRREFFIGTQTSSTPMFVTVKPDLSVGLGPAPNDVYVVRGEYKKIATELSGNSDTPEMPAEHHDLIVWWALVKYGAHDAAPEVYSFAESERKRMLRNLERKQRPQIILPGAMV